MQTSFKRAHDSSILSMRSQSTGEIRKRNYVIACFSFLFYFVNKIAYSCASNNVQKLACFQ